FSQTLRTEQQPSALPHGGARPQAPVAPHSTRPQRARAAAWRSGPAWPGRAPRAASRSAAGRADDGRNAAAPVRGAAGVYGRELVAFELSAGVPASAARAPGLERETAPSSGEARRLRRRAGSHVDSKEKKKLRPKAPSRRLGHRQSGNCRPQQRAQKESSVTTRGERRTFGTRTGRAPQRWSSGRANWRRRGPPG
ncbi:unnamed protein product, partial [Prorocentrum cordatum]